MEDGTVPLVSAQYYKQNKHVISKCKHLNVLSFTLVRTGNDKVIPLGLVIVPFDINGIKLQIHTLIWIVNTLWRRCHGKLALEHLKCVPDHTNKQLHIKRSIYL